ncbi:MAG: hypothetical protein M3Y48_23650 [Actinomycetota bacterium]|nr:hypothetical protein [Actinomycetota bacterium]
MTDHDDQRPAATTTGKGAPTLTRRQHHTSPDTPDVGATAQHAPATTTQPLATYIRHVVDTAPRPTPDQLARLAGLLRNTDDNPDVPS